MIEHSPADNSPLPPDPVTESWVRALVAQVHALDQATDDETRRALLWGTRVVTDALEGRLDEGRPAGPRDGGEAPDAPAVGPARRSRWARVAGMVGAVLVALPGLGVTDGPGGDPQGGGAGDRISIVCHEG